MATLRVPALGVQATPPPDIYGPKPEIVHQFRVPGKRPPEVISLFFAGVAVLPLLGLVYGLYNSGVNFKVSFHPLQLL